MCWGEKDPWTPAERVLGLSRFPTVERVVPLPDVGHCPHDEAPELVNPLLVDFVRRCADAAAPGAGGAERGEVVPSKGGARRSGEVKMGLFDAIGKAFSNEEFKEDDQRVSSLGFDSRAMLQPADERVFGSRLCQVRASHILIKGDDDVERCVELLGEIGGLVQSDPDGLARIFADVARRESTCASSSQGGDLGSFGPGKMVAEFDAALFPEDMAAAPPPGSVLGPIVTEFGAHLILVTKREVSNEQIEEKLARND